MQGKTFIRNFRITGEMDRALDRLAQARGESKSFIIRELIRQAARTLDQQQRSTPTRRADEVHREPA